MKKRFLLFTMMLLPLAVSAKVEIDGIYYNLNSDAKTAEVTYGSQAYVGDIVIPASITVDDVVYNVTSIGKETFSYCQNLTSVDIPEGVTTIGSNAFYLCQNLVSITIPSTLENIGNGMFRYCNLKKVIINSNALISKNRSWMGEVLLKDIFGSTVEEINLGENITRIGNLAFHEFKKLTSIQMTHHVTSIGSGAFQNCVSLTSIIIPNSVTSIDYNPFYGCENLSSIQVENGNAVFDSRDNCNAIIRTADNVLITGGPNTVIPNSVTEIGGGAFYNNANLTSINIPSSVVKIGSSAFWQCTSLTSISIPSSMKTIEEWAFFNCKNLASVSIADGITRIEKYVFEGCQSLTSFTIPTTVTSIGEEAFSGCKLTSITIPKSVTSIENNAFWGCAFGATTIQVEEGNSVYDSRNNCNAIIRTADNTLILGCRNTIIPNNITTIGASAFSACEELSSINIPEGIMTIEDNAFNYSGLTYVVIPSSVTTIGSRAFYGCQLSDIYCYAEQLPEAGEDAFGYQTRNIKLHVPAVSLDVYKNAEFWKLFIYIVALTDEDPKPTTGIAVPTTTQIPIAVGRYTLDGKRISKPQHGLNIIKMSDGTTRKEFVK